MWGVGDGHTFLYPSKRAVNYATRFVFHIFDPDLVAEVDARTFVHIVSHTYGHAFSPLETQPDG